MIEIQISDFYSQDLYYFNRFNILRLDLQWLPFPSYVEMQYFYPTKIFLRIFGCCTVIDKYLKYKKKQVKLV